MWVLFGLGAIAFAILNVAWTLRNNSAKWFRFVSISLTVFTMCAFYSDGARRVLDEDWAGLMDIMPTMSKALWVCCIISVLLNSISLFKGKER